MSSSPFLHKGSSTTLPLSQTRNLDPDEHRWVLQIRQSLEEEEDQEDDNNFTVSIACVPKILMSSKPEAYIPQQVALGPYHYWQPELYEMRRYKIAAAKRRQKQFLSGQKFQNLVENHLAKLDSRVRSCYHKYLDFNRETLAWIMAVDASFLLEFLEVFVMKEGNNVLPKPKVSPSMSLVVDYLGQNSSHNMILRDIMMLENQIPLFLLRKILELQSLSLETANHILYSMLIGIFRDVSPLKILLDENFSSKTQASVVHCFHLLDFLYCTLVGRKPEGTPSNIDIKVEEFGEDNEEVRLREKNMSTFGNRNYVKKLIQKVWELLKKSIRGPIHLTENVILSRPVELVARSPWTIITHLPGFTMLKGLQDGLFSSSQDKQDIQPEKQGQCNIDRPPLMEEITIPSVTELFKTGVSFSPTEGNIQTIKFDKRTNTLHLPTVCLDVNTEIIIRNLVAYETSTIPGALVFTRYTELMNGIIDTAEDAKLLREKGVILNSLKNDEDVANMWNGMTRSVRLTKEPMLDKVIEDVNKYYSSRWKVRMKKFTRSYVNCSWQFLTFLGAVLLLQLTGLQAFCLFYRCSRFFKVKTTQ